VCVCVLHTYTRTHTHVHTHVSHTRLTAWVHPEFETATQETLERLEQAWNCADEKDECEVRLEGLERNYWVGSEVGRIGGYEFQGEVFGSDGSNHNGQMGAGCCRLGAPEADQTTRVGREEEGSSSNRPELGGVVLSLSNSLFIKSLCVCVCVCSLSLSLSLSLSVCVSMCVRVR
jgi:hypothetical protein